MPQELFGGMWVWTPSCKADDVAITSTYAIANKDRIEGTNISNKNTYSSSIGPHVSMSDQESLRS